MFLIDAQPTTANRWRPRRNKTYSFFSDNFTQVYTIIVGTIFYQIKKKFNLVNEVKLRSREGIPRLKTDVETV
ncbi:hypothetical protein PL10110_310015 [Planktothrix agardhii]|nr:hypothetical protein PL10110_310015 [Planktothrix agardhii]